MSINFLNLTRRAFLTTVGVGAASAMLPNGMRSAWLNPQETSTSVTDVGMTLWNGNTSANGWPIDSTSSDFLIEGTNWTVALADGSPATILLHAIRRFNYEIDTLREHEVHGRTTDRNVLSAERSNLLSGTAALIRPGFYPYGDDGNMYPNEVLVIEDIIAEAGGVLEWGGHLSVPDQCLLYIATGPTADATHKLSDSVESSDRMDEQGGAGQIDAFDPQRIEASEKFNGKRK